MTGINFSQETLSGNLSALARANPTAAAWLAGPLPKEGLAAVAADDGTPVLVVDGLSQDSRRAPRAEARRLLESCPALAIPANGPWLFGLSGQATLAEALSSLPSLTVFEPDPRVAKATLALQDLSGPLGDGRLAIFSPWEKAQGATPPLSPVLVTHPASKRRQIAAWAGLRGFLGQGYLPAGGAGPRLLLVPPYSGGSEPLGGFLLRAALDLGLAARLLDWPPELRRLAQAAKIDPRATAGGLLAGSALETARAAKDFRPDLILALAQAPLDAQGLALLRDEAPWARLAFWFVEDFNRFRYVSGVAPAYDLFFHIQGRLMDGELRDWGLARAWYLPLAADASLFRPQTVPERFRAKLSLAGAGYPNRRAILADLAQNFWARGRWGNYRFRIFGSGWEGCPEVLARHLFEGGRRLTAEECALAYAGGEVNLNLHSGNGSGFDGPSAFVNPRTFELAASQSLQIVDDRLLLEGLFGPGELEIVRDPAQLPGAIEKHLNDPELGRDMALRARRRVLREHLYAHRLRFILGCL